MLCSSLINQIQDHLNVFSSAWISAGSPTRWQMTANILEDDVDMMFPEEILPRVHLWLLQANLFHNAAEGREQLSFETTSIPKHPLWQ